MSASAASAHDGAVPPPGRAAGLTRAGVRGIEKVIRLRTGDREQLYDARLEASVDFAAATATEDRMTALEEQVDQAIGEVILGETVARAESLACRLAERLRDAQGAPRAEVTIEARYPEQKPAPVSGIPTQELYTLIGTAVAHAGGTRRLVGVSAQGMLASPRTQDAVAARTREMLAGEGFDADRVDRIMRAVPMATENCRGFGTLRIGLDEATTADLEAADLLAIVEGSMSSEIYELMKRSDERAVVQRAHARPRSVQDCVHAMIAGVLERYAGLPDGSFVAARQESLETTRRHTVVAERTGLLGELRAGTARGDGAHATLRAWLDAA
jgi:GTP cyclohydrolase IV